MKGKLLLLKISFALLLLVGGLHTFFILIGGPQFPDTTEFVRMQELMRTVSFDTGGNVQRTMQNILDGFNIIVSIFLISLPSLSWMMLVENRENESAIRKLTWVNLVAVFAFFITSLMLLAIGGTVVAGLICLLLVISLLIRK